MTHPLEIRDTLDVRPNERGTSAGPAPSFDFLIAFQKHFFSARPLLAFPCAVALYVVSS